MSFFLLLFSFSLGILQAQTGLFLELPEKQQEKLNNKDRAALYLFWAEGNYNTNFSPGVLFLGEYDYVDSSSNRVRLRLIECGNDICFDLDKEGVKCKFSANRIKLTPNKKAFVMDSERCRIKGTNFEEIKKITTLVILDKTKNKFIVTGDLLRGVNSHTGKE